MKELPDAVFVRMKDVVRWSGLPRRTVRKILENGAKSVCPKGYCRRLWLRESVLRCFGLVRDGDGK